MSSNRFQEEVKTLENLEQSFLEDDDISGLTLAEVEERLRGETSLPEGFRTCILHQNLLIYLIGIRDDVPHITGSITVKADLTVSLTVDNKVVPSSQYDTKESAQTYNRQ